MNRNVVEGIIKLCRCVMNFLANIPGYIMKLQQLSEGGSDDSKLFKPNLLQVACWTSQRFFHTKLSVALSNITVCCLENKTFQSFAFLAGFLEVWDTNRVVLFFYGDHKYNEVTHAVFRRKPQKCSKHEFWEGVQTDRMLCTHCGNDKQLIWSNMAADAEHLK